jgi:MinD-like ATPase involved in chromosome partitioning or flagellar assembly
VSLRVVTALPDRAFEAEVVRRLSRADSGATVVRRCLDAVELRSVAGAGQADVVIVDLALRGLDRDVVTELHAQGLRVVGTASNPVESTGWGVDAVVPQDADLVCSALRGGTQRPLPVPRPPGDDGQVVVVWGPVGSPGRTMVAVTLADELSRLGVETLLVDADTYGPSVAQQLGLLDDASGLAAVCRLASQNRLDAAAVVGSAVSLRTGLRVLTGLPRADRWDELRPSALDSVWQLSRDIAAVTVVDVGFCLEHDDLTWFEPGIPSRNQAAVATLGAADIVVGVGSSDAVGLVRYLRAVGDARALAPTARIEHVVNRMPAARESRAEVRALVAGHLPDESVRYLATDASSLASAMRSGRTLAEVSPRSALRRELVALAEEVGGVRAGRRRRRAA